MAGSLSERELILVDDLRAEAARVADKLETLNEQLDGDENGEDGLTAADVMGEGDDL